MKANVTLKEGLSYTWKQHVFVKERALVLTEADEIAAVKSISILNVEIIDDKPKAAVAQVAKPVLASAPVAKPMATKPVTPKPATPKPVPKPATPKVVDKSEDTKP